VGFDKTPSGDEQLRHGPAAPAPRARLPRRERQWHRLQVAQALTAQRMGMALLIDGLGTLESCWVNRLGPHDFRSPHRLHRPVAGNSDQCVPLASRCRRCGRGLPGSGFLAQGYVSLSTLGNTQKPFQL
jgi:hypothetical protein